MTALEQMCAALSPLAGGGGRVLAALDGPCASGKTTLAGQAARQLGCPLVHMDDFFLPPARKTPAPLVLVEGVYALHPALRDFYRLRIFLEAPWPVRRARLLDRGGPELLARFQGEWVPLEDRYFQACRVRDCCQLVLSGQ